MTEIDPAAAAGGLILGERVQRLTGEFMYEETAYHLPISFALTGREVHDAQTAKEVFELSGKSPLVAIELLLAAQAASTGKEPDPYTGFIGDAVIRKLGYSLVDGSILGLAMVLGTPPNADTAAAICRELQEKYMLTFLAGEVVPVLSAAHVKVGLDYRLVPLGSTPLQGIHLVDIITRVALMFGGVVPGDPGRLVNYAIQRAKAIVIVFPGLDDESIAFVDSLRVPRYPDHLPRRIRRRELGHLIPAGSGREGNGPAWYQSKRDGYPDPDGLFPGIRRKEHTERRRCMSSSAAGGRLHSNSSGCSLPERLPMAGSGSSARRSGK